MTTPTPASSTLDRRGFVRMLGGGALALAGLAALRPEDAQAGIGWCRADPIVRLNGTQLQFWVSVLEENLPMVNGPLNCRVQTPKNVQQELLFLDAGFNGHGEHVTFTTAGNRTAEPGEPFLVNIWVEVPNSKQGRKFPIVLDVLPSNGPAVTKSGNAGRTDVSLMVTPTL